MIRPVALVALVAASVASAQAPAAPKLVIDVSVDGLSPELANEYRTHLVGELGKLVGGPAAGVTARSALTGRSIKVAGDSAGAARQDSWFWNGRGFASNSIQPPPRSVALVNSGVQRLVGSSEPALVPPPFCTAKARPGDRRFARAAGDLHGFETSPALDGATLALAAGLVEDFRLGRGTIPDRLSIDLSATGRVARAYGPGSEEMCLQLFALDRELQDFVRALDRMNVDYTIQLDR